MNTRTKILSLLEESRSQYVSGEQIAAKLGISRNAVWKAIKELQKAGHDIEAVTNKGYRLSEDSDVLSVGGIAVYLTQKEISQNISIHEVLESTNETAKEMAVSGTQGAAVVIANRQTAGKGRYGRAFHSPPESGLYMSFILQSASLNFKTPTLITAFAAVCVCEAIEAISCKKPQIKWVNDVFIDRRKVCGILTEAVTDFESGSTGWIVVGIGVNFKKTELPEELKEIAGAVFSEDKPPVTRNRLCAEIINRMTSAQVDEEKMLANYKNRMNMLGKKVTVTSRNAEEAYEAVAIDVDETGRLIIRKENGEQISLTAGEISVKI
jgi:BirA family biotin operon repressor/biotin-[acetyl-CoA-carboxylase] ligase